MFQILSRLVAIAVLASAFSPMATFAVTAQDCGSGSVKCDDIQIHKYLYTPTAPGCGANTPVMPDTPPRPPGTFAPWPAKGFGDEGAAVQYVHDSFLCSTNAYGMCEDLGIEERSGYTLWSSYQGGIAATENKDQVWKAKFWTGSPQTCTDYREFAFIMQRRTELACPPGHTSQFDTATGRYFCYRNIVCDENCRAGNPIHIANADKALDETDFVGGGPFALRIDRQYGHRRINQPFVDAAAPVPVALGQGWRHGYERYLRVWGASPARRALIVRPNGLYAWFFESASGWSGRKDEKGALAEVKDAGGVTTGWEYRDAPDAMGGSPVDEVYSAAGALASLIDRSGLAQQMGYDAQGRLAQVTDASGRSLQFAYGTDGRLASITAPTGEVYGYAYNADGMLASVGLPGGGSRTYHYEAANMPFALTGVTDERGVRKSTYSYDSCGNAYSTEYAGSVGRHTVTRSGTTSTVVDPLGVSRSYVFSLNSPQNAYVLTSVTQPEGNGFGNKTRSFQYDGSGNVTRRTDFNGVVSTYTFDTSRNLETSRVQAYGGYGRCPDGGSYQAGNYISNCTTGTCWSTAAFFLSQSAAPLGYPTWQYACAAPATMSTKVSTEWHASERLPKRIAEPKRRTTFAYHGEAGVSCAPAGASTALLCARTEQATLDATGNSGFSATLTGALRTWSFTYSAAGRLLTADGPRTDVADVTSYVYHAADDPGGNFRAGDLASVTNALGHATMFTHYDGAGLLKRMVDANGLATELDYWPRGWLKSRRIVKAPSIDETTLYDYTAAGDLAKVTRPDGSWLAFTHDDAQRLAGLSDNLGNSITYVLDAMGNRRQEQVRDTGGALRQLRQREFNAMNRLWKEIGAAGQTTVYQHDVMGNLRTIAAPASLARPLATQTFDALGRLVQAIDPDGGSVKFEFDGIDQLTKVTDPRSLATTYTVDGLGNQSALASPDTGTTNNTLFDEAGNLRQSTDARGKTVTHTFDALNRLASATWAGESVTYTFDQGANALGRLTGIGDATGSTQYTFDAAGRVLTDTRTIGGVVLATSYGWDAAGRLSSIAYPSGKVVQYAFDAAGRISGASVTAGTTTQIASNIAYHPFGVLTGLTFGSGGMSYTRTVDQDGRVASYTLGATTFNLFFDDAGNITRISDPANTALDRVFAYDRIDRLLSLSTNPTTLNQTFTYDKVGNRLTRVLNGATTNYTLATTSNRMTAVGGVSRSFDGAGNQIADGTSSFTYSDRGRLTGATTPLGSVTYAVNALGQRVKKTVGTVSTLYAFDLEGGCWASTTQRGPRSRRQCGSAAPPWPRSGPMAAPTRCSTCGRTTSTRRAW